jgi:uncharacterized protein
VGVKGEEIIRSVFARDTGRMTCLHAVRDLDLPDCWIAAGFVRNAIWDHLHNRPALAIDGDVDVIWFDPLRSDAQMDLDHERQLTSRLPEVMWSVKNQARMHHRNGDNAYLSAIHAMQHWPETATAVAVRLDATDRLEIAAPFGLADLLALRLAPTPWCSAQHPKVFAERVKSKGWQQRYPLLSS